VRSCVCVGACACMPIRLSRCHHVLIESPPEASAKLNIFWLIAADAILSVSDFLEGTIEIFMGILPKAVWMERFLTSEQFARPNTRKEVWVGVSDDCASSSLNQYLL
jgi:hypothetical protein